MSRSRTGWLRSAGGVARVGLVLLGAGVVTAGTARFGPQCVSVDATGDEGAGSSRFPSISANGRYVAFESTAPDLVPGDGNGSTDIFVHDRKRGVTTRVSVDSAGVEGNGQCRNASISANGRFVAFDSLASNLVAGDDNDTYDVFVHDRKRGTTECVSVDSAGTAGDDGSTYPSISANGRYVAFGSLASDLVAGDANGVYDVFVRDRKRRRTTRVSVHTSGTEATAASYGAEISARGRFVAFHSTAGELVSDDGNGTWDVFVHDLRKRGTIRASVSSTGSEAHGTSHYAALSRSGRYVGFFSTAADLVAGDTNAVYDVFVRDLRKGLTTRVSVASSGTEGDGPSRGPSLSGNGRYVAFYSSAANLVPGDGNAAYDVFLHDRKKGRTTRVSVDSAGVEATGPSDFVQISGNGRVLAFQSLAPNLVPGDTNAQTDVFVRGRK